MNNAKNYPFIILLILPLFFLLSFILKSEGQPDARPAQAEEIHARWVQLIQAPAAGSESMDFPVQAIVRAVMEPEQGCPVLRLEKENSGSLPMAMRANPAPHAFPVKVCQALVPLSAKETKIFFPDGEILKAPGLLNGMSLYSVIALGDSGCRGASRQNCDNPEDWPFQRVADTAAQAVEGGTKAPDLIIHVGDYVYRGAESWISWQADFFTPAQNLLKAGPWVMVRGNHETCSNNSGQGFLLFLDPDISGKTVSCSKRKKTPYFSPPYAMDVAKDLRLIVFDSSGAKSFGNGVTDRYQKMWDKTFPHMAPKASGRSAWFLTHVPPWGVGEDSGRSILWADNDILRNPESANPLKKPVSAVIVGDLHMFEKLTFPDNPDRPTEYIVGNGGVKLDKKLPGIPIDRLEKFSLKKEGKGVQTFSGQAIETVGGKPVNWEGKAIREHGFMSIQRKEDGGEWQFGLWTLHKGRFIFRELK